MSTSLQENIPDDMQGRMCWNRHPFRLCLFRAYKGAVRLVRRQWSRRRVILAISAHRFFWRFPWTSFEFRVEVWLVVACI